jgi:hypothetical protein
MRTLAALLLLLSGACAGDQPGALTVLDSSQRALDSGDPVPLVLGPQGGYHAALLLETPGLASGPATLDVVATGREEGESLNARLPVQLATEEGMTMTEDVVALILCPGPLAIEGSAYHFRWLMTDLHADSLETELDLSPRCPDGDETCPEICSAGAD